MATYVQQRPIVSDSLSLGEKPRAQIIDDQPRRRTEFNTITVGGHAVAQVELSVGQRAGCFATSEEGAH